MAVMGSGDTVVGNAIPKSDQAAEKGPAATDPRQSPKPRRQQQMCGAMTQQGDDNHSPSRPQEFVRLVGYRNPKVRPPGAPS
jgi:hypothetical protein